MPPTLGQRLKLAREARHLSHQDIAFQIKIPPARVKDLEEDSYTAFGSLTYARSFLKTYATFLEVDASEILEHIQSPPLGGAGDYRYLTTDLGPWVDPDESSHQAMVPPRPSMRSSKSLVAAAVICSCILLAGVSVLITNSSLFRAKSPTQDPVASASLGEKPSPAADVTVMSAETKALQAEVPPRAFVVPDKNAPPPRAEIVQ